MDFIVLGDDFGVRIADFAAALGARATNDLQLGQIAVRIPKYLISKQYYSGYRDIPLTSNSVAKPN